MDKTTEARRTRLVYLGYDGVLERCMTLEDENERLRKRVIDLEQKQLEIEDEKLAN